MNTGDPGRAPSTPATGTTGLITEQRTAVDDPDGHERAVWKDIR